MVIRKKDLNPGKIIEPALSVGASLAGVVSKETGTFLVLALEHNESEPRLDWWDGSGGTAGNRKLIRISKKLKRLFKEEFGIEAVPLPYHVEKGGIYLKDAAVMAGLGVIGKNNLLVTPRFGPAIRLRAVSLDIKVINKGQLDFNPCQDCQRFCWQACPEKAFRSGSYDKELCNKQMHKNEAERVVDSETGKVVVKYCRACELSCPLV